MNLTALKKLQRRLMAARGDIPVDLLIEDCRVVNVFDAKVEDAPVAIYDGIVVGIGKYKAHERFNLNGDYLLPGLIESHIHIESSKLTPQCFAEAVIPHGTTAVVADPHEIANVLGVEGIEYMLDATRGLDLDVFFMLPSCVPATDMETAGASLSASDLKPILRKDGVIGIAELMNFPGAYMGDAQLLSKALLAGDELPIDGHAPGLGGRNLSAYLIAGPATDHECISFDEAAEKLSRGMRIMIREGSTARNLDALLPLVNAATERRITFASDDRSSGDLQEQGHIDHILRRAVTAGLEPMTAVRMATLNAAETHRLHRRGGIRPGWRADLAAVKDLREFKVSAVWKDGQLVAKNGKCTRVLSTESDLGRRSKLNVPSLRSDAFAITDQSSKVRVIGVVPNQIVTEHLTAKLPSAGGRLESDIEDDIIKLAVIERHSGRGGWAMGFVKGLGLRYGAIASTVAHDSHNIIVAGVDDESMHTAVRRLVWLGGGQVVAAGCDVLCELPLPIAGLMCDLPVSQVTQREQYLLSAARNLGSQLADPLMALSFLALPVIPALKLTDKGLVDVEEFKLVSLFV